MIAKVRNQTLDSFAGLGVVTHDTLAEYEALTDAEKMDGNVHLVLEEEPINANIVEYTNDKTVKEKLDDLASDLGNKSTASDVTGANAFAKIHQLNADLTAKQNKLTISALQDMHEQISVSGGTQWAPFTIPAGTWILFFNIQYIPTMDWFHVVNSNNQSIMDCLGAGDGSSTSIALYQSSTATAAKLSSDATHLSELFRATVYGIRYN